MKTDLTKMGYSFSQVIDSMTSKDARPQDIQAAIGIVMNARNLWLDEGLAAAATFFDARKSKAETKEEPAEESLFEIVDVGAGNINQDDDNDLAGIDGNLEDEDEEEIIREGNALITEAFKIIEVNAELLASQSYWTPLIDALDSIFVMMNELEVVTGDSDEAKAHRRLFAELNDTIKVNVFSKEGVIMLWEELHSIFMTHSKY